MWHYFSLFPQLSAICCCLPSVTCEILDQLNNSGQAFLQSPRHNESSYTVNWVVFRRCLFGEVFQRWLFSLSYFSLHSTRTSFLDKPIINGNTISRCENNYRRLIVLLNKEIATAQLASTSCYYHCNMTQFKSIFNFLFFKFL